MPVAQRQPSLGALVRRGADHRRQLRLDQRLIDRGCRLPNPVIDIRGLEHLKQVEQGRLVQSHRVMCPSARTIGVVPLTLTRWPSQTWSPTPRRPTTYTTNWDVTWAKSPSIYSDTCPANGPAASPTGPTPA